MHFRYLRVSFRLRVQYASIKNVKPPDAQNDDYRRASSFWEWIRHIRDIRRGHNSVIVSDNRRDFARHFDEAQSAPGIGGDWQR
jgi:hypothetical protein